MTTVIIPIILLKKILYKHNTWICYQRYCKQLAKKINAEKRVKFLNECRINDLVPDFLKFRIPDVNCFEPSTVKNFQLRLLSKELYKAREESKRKADRLDSARQELKKVTPEHLLPSVTYNAVKFMKETVEEVDARHAKKLHKLSRRQEQPLRSKDDRTVKVVGDIDLPQHVQELLAYGPKHPIRGPFNDMHFLASIDRLLSAKKPDKDTDNDIQALSTWYIKQNRRIPQDSAVDKVSKYLRQNGLLAIPFDKGVGFCVMRCSEYESKLNDILNGPQFIKLEIEDSDVKKHESKINRILADLKKKNSISEEFYHQIRSTGAQPARMYGLAKAHKSGTPLRPVLSLPGSCYYNINKAMTKFFEKVPGANIETSTQRSKEALEKVKLEENEHLFSLDVKSLYTNVPVQEAIEIAVRKAYAQPNKPSMRKSVFKKLLELAVCNVHFKANGIWYQQIDGVAMGASLAVVLANLWLKEYENMIFSEDPTASEISIYDKCPKCSRKVQTKNRGIECDRCQYWFHGRCARISNDELDEWPESREWYCERCQNPDNTLSVRSKIALRYMDDVVRTSRASPDVILSKCNRLHTNLEFTIELLDQEKSIVFLDMKIKRRSDGFLETEWYRKPSDTDTLLNYRSCAPISFKKNLIQGTVHRIFNATSTWPAFDEALSICNDLWRKNQYPEEFTDQIVLPTIEKCMGRESNSERNATRRYAREEGNSDKSRERAN